MLEARLYLLPEAAGCVEEDSMLSKEGPAGHSLGLLGMESIQQAEYDSAAPCRPGEVFPVCGLSHVRAGWGPWAGRLAGPPVGGSAGGALAMKVPLKT